MVDRDVVVAKIATIDRCLVRIREVQSRTGAALLPADVEDIVVLNLQRATQAAIDLAAHVASTEGYGIPSDLAEGFTLLYKHGLIDEELASKLRKMVGFRNIAVHQYEALDPKIVSAIVRGHLDDLRHFAAAVLKTFGLAPG